MAEEIVVGRGDPAYLAHAYLTKVPVPAITPFIEAYCPPGGVVVDPFAGSGMTGVAARITGRRARLSDISVLGRHIGSNYLNMVEAYEFADTAQAVVKRAQDAVGKIYEVPCDGCGGNGRLAKTVWSVLVRCAGCEKPVNYYHSLEAAAWSKPNMVCPHCSAHISSRLPRVGEEPVVDYVNCACSPKQREQPAVTAPGVHVDGLDFPHVEITPDREMYRASALGKSGNTTVASFYSPRNRCTLVALRDEIRRVEDRALSQKLLFAFTATLTRASKRYQWSHKRPLNAANQNYYIAPVFYEWNVFELFERKATAVLKSDDWIRAQAFTRNVDADAVHAEYVTESAAELSLPDASADYVFTDPPFGSNLFYADMALFQEGWLDGFTDVGKEAVIDRSTGTKRTAGRYEALLTESLKQCRRILKPGGRISMVFGNSSGKIWAVVQRAVAAAGLRIEPEKIAILNKGQRSVKGLASGFEHVATLDLVLTMVPQDDAEASFKQPTAEAVAAATRELVGAAGPASPSHLYLELLRRALREGWSVADLDLETVTATLLDDGWSIDPKTGLLAGPA
ncbi:DNA methyltransferase [Streptomyces sp. NPDC057116]|uniref:DNA methyltransferase n=1 Tax=Streptomyces sp. NPDC057116 TaxID=3346023 RepID=UPI0036395459